jgi:hypothetical protein
LLFCLVIIQIDAVLFSSAALMLLLNIFGRLIMRLLRKSLAYALAFSMAATQITAPASAFRLKDIVRDLTNIPKQALKIINPITTPIQIITGKQNPLKPQEFIRQQGAAIGSIVESTRRIVNAQEQAAAELAQKVGGNTGRVIFEYGSGLDRYHREFVFTAAQQGAGALQGQDPLWSIAMPVAAAIRDAKAKYEAQAKPLPDDVKRLFAPIIPQAILDRARYTTDDAKISLPSLINNVQNLLGKQYAVTVDNIMVFVRPLDFNNLGDLKWLAHELFHTRQYQEWGIDQFAYNYLKNKQAVEDQAEAAGSFALSYIQQLANGQNPQPVVTHVSATTFIPQAVKTPLGDAMVMVAYQPNGVTPEIQQRSGMVQQPIYTNRFNFQQRCDINGETILITSDGFIIAPMRGYTPFGERQAPWDQRCYRDLAFPAARMCMTANGDVLGAGGWPVGRCMPCSAPGACPQ